MSISRRRARALFCCVLLTLIQTGCPAFALPRPARVEPGLSASVSIVAASPPGDAASWFWRFDCTSNCDRTLVAPAFFVRSSVPGGESPRGEVGLGLAGTSVHAEGYMLLSEPENRPWGLGARLSLTPPYGHNELYARIDLREDGARTLFVNPTYAFHANRGNWFHALMLPIGSYETEDDGAMTIALTPALAYTSRPEALRGDERSAVSAFVVLSGTFTLRFSDD